MNAATGKRRTTVLLVLTLAVLASAALVLDRFHVALDLTSSGTWSLSKVSRNLYKELPDRVHITYYVSPELVSRHPGPRQVEEFLRKYEGVGHGLISVSVADPKDLGGPIESLGLKPQRIQVIEDNQARVAVVYSGIVVQYLDRTEAVPFVIGLDSLEYDVVKAVNRAVTGKAAMAAVMVGDGDKSWENDYRSLSDALTAAGWTVSVLSPGDAIPPDTGVLLVLGNSAIDDYAAYRIDDYVARGGSAFLALRGLDVQTSYGLQAVPLKDDAMARLLAAWGVTISPELVLDASSRTLPFQEQGPTGGLQVRYVKYPHWLTIRPEDCSKANPVTANLAGLDLMWPSPLSLSALPGVKSEELVKSTSKAWLQTKDFAIAPEDEGSYDREAGSTTGQYLLAASLAGNLPIAHAGKPLPSRKGAAALPPLPTASAASRVIVVGSADFATDLMSLTDSTFNAGFAANAVEWAAYGADLAALKSRGGRDNSLSKVADPAKRSLIILFAFGLNLVLIPGGLAVVGLVRSRRRKALAQAPSIGGAPPPSASGPESAGASHARGHEGGEA